MRRCTGFANPEPMIALAFFALLVAILIPRLGLLFGLLAAIGIIALLALALKFSYWLADRRRK